MADETTRATERVKPCGGRNTNICVAEGCYGEACTRNVRPVCLRCEVPIHRDDDGVWRREATGSQVCPRNPAVDGHEPRSWDVDPDGPCNRLVIGPDTDGEPCDWCQNCGESAEDHRPIRDEESSREGEA